MIDNSGSGFGLSISKAYVELFGGKIWVESEFGQGSSLYFTIPYDSVKKVQKDLFQKPVVSTRYLKFLLQRIMKYLKNLFGNCMVTSHGK